ncbi:MAG: hypothetical protein ACLT1W_11165 [Alistipes onderdonkii]
MTLIKSISGIRGTVGGAQAGNLTPPDVVKFTTAYARLAARRKAGKKLTIVVGRDARISGEMVADLVEGTLLACGADVINVGLCTTPGVEMAVIAQGRRRHHHHRLANPRQWNALKLLNADGEFLSDAEETGAAMAEGGLRIPHRRRHRARPFANRSTNGTSAQVLALPLVVPGHPCAPLQGRCGRREFGGHRDARIAATTGVRGRGANCDPTGEFAHNPEPLPENLTEIAGVIRRRERRPTWGSSWIPMSTGWHWSARTARCSSRSTRGGCSRLSSRSTRAGTAFPT